jgi:hypothetical protein
MMSGKDRPRQTSSLKLEEKVWGSLWHVGFVIPKEDACENGPNIPLVGKALHK